MAALNTSRYFQPLCTNPADADLELHRRLCDVDLVTRRLRQLVPLLEFIDCRAVSISAEKAVFTVPLLESAMNQNGTHQASIFYLVADYTLGTAMFASVPGCYAIAIHDRCPALPVQFWLKSGTVEHWLPGAGTLRAEAAIPKEIAERLRRDLIGTGECTLEHSVQFFSGKDLVAEVIHEMAMYSDMPRCATESTSLTQVHRLKTSAMMVAALRGDPASLSVAGDQGVAIAQRFTRDTPQIGQWIRARTMAVDQVIEMEGPFNQIVLLGAGLDTKPLKQAQPPRKWFAADLAPMLRERRRRFESVGLQDEQTMYVPIDLRRADWPDKILRSGFDPEVPSLMVLEGVSMYLDANDLIQMYERLERLCGSRLSAVWCDHISDDIFRLDLAEVHKFLSNMSRLGEPFVTGFKQVAELVGKSWQLQHQRSAADVLARSDPVAENYLFSTMSYRPCR